MAKRISHLDCVRGLAALAVCAGHLRAFQFVVLNEAAEVSLLDKVFYAITGYGHQAVMVFFVLSGYFVAGSVSDAVQAQRWSWNGYALRRLTRLWLVLIPALLLTFAWDRAGLSMAGGAGYDGDFSLLIHSGPNALQPWSGGFMTFLGNIGFLQGIVTPVFGTNGPLWSLANEFWYYLLFPLGLFVVHPRSSARGRASFGALFGLIVWFLPLSVLAGFGIWLLGYGVHIGMKANWFRRVLGSRGCFATSCVAFLLSLIVVRRHLVAGGDLLVGLTFSGMLPFAIKNQPPEGWYVRLSTAISEMSYTLYVVHFPLLAFLFFSFRLPQKSQPNLLAYLSFFGILAVVMAYAWIIWWLFEKRTDRARKKVEGYLSRAVRAMEPSTVPGQTR